MERVIKTKLLAAVAVCLSLLGCGKEVGGGDSPAGRTDSIGQPIHAENGIVRFFVTAEGGDALTAGAKIQVNGMSYVLRQDASGHLYVDVKESADKVYAATDVPGASANVNVPYSQFAGEAAQSDSANPRFAFYSEASGNLLTLRPAWAGLKLSLKGSLALSSVKVRSLGGQAVAGDCVYADGQFSLAEGLDFVVVNCTDNGRFVPLSLSGTDITVKMAPGAYPEGFEVTVCTSNHRMYRTTLPGATLSAGVTHSESLTVQPAADQLFYEGFDNFVWGGNWMGGEGAYGYVPADSDINSLTGQVKNGYAPAAVKVAYNVPGNGYFQSDNWDEVKSSNVGESNIATKSYIMSRNIADWDHLFRSKEYQGMIGVGVGTVFRGIVQTPPMPVQGLRDIRVNFKFCFKDGADDDFLFQVVNAGHVTACKVDGRAVPAEIGYYLRTGSAALPRQRISVPSSAVEPKTWHEIEITVSGASDATRLQFSANSTESGTHGFFIDDIEVRSIAGSAKKGNLRLLYMNIQNGMWADQGSNYDNFVAWIQRYQPDVCVWCEAETIYKTGTDSYISNRYLPGGWGELAARYGHTHVANSGNRDDYSQEITSTYAITTRQRITTSDDSSRPISHGAGHFQISVNGKTINFVTCHLWPKNSGTGAVAASDDSYRAYELDYLIRNTVNNSSYASEQYWVLLGDMNSMSPLDSWLFPNYSETDSKFSAQKVVHTKTDLKDVIGTWYPAPQFVQSTYGKDRRDYIYVSPELLQNVVRVSCFTDSFTPGTKTNISNFSIPSDHRPFIVDFNL